MGVRLTPFPAFDASVLLEDPTATQLQVLEFIGASYAQNDFRWPVFDWVQGHFERNGIDVWAELVTLPAAEAAGGYYAVALPRSREPQPDQRVALTMLGLFQAEVMRQFSTTLPALFVEILRIMATRRREEPRSMNTARTFEISGAELLAALEPVRRGFGDLSADFIADLIEREPPTWPTIQNRNDQGWTGRIPRTVIPFFGVENIRDYLDRLVQTLTRPATVAPPAVPSPLDLVAAIDYLDTVWRLARPQAGHLFSLHGAQQTAQLAFDANTPAEFESRLSGLSDILHSFTLPDDAAQAKGRKRERDKPLAPLRDYLSQLLPESAGRIESAVSVLQDVIDARDAGQHRRASAKRPRAFASLGVGYPPTSWSSAWSTISAKTIEALEALREELATLTK